MSNATSERSRFSFNLSDSNLRTLYWMAAFLALIIIAITSLPYFGIGVRHSDQCFWEARPHTGKQYLIIDSVVRGGAAERAGVKVGDTVVSIDGTAIPHNNAAQVGQTLLDLAPTKTPIPYVVERDSQRIELRISLIEEERDSISNPLFLAFPLFTLIWLAVGLMVALSQPRGVVQRRFFLAAATAAFAFAVPANVRQGMQVLGMSYTSSQSTMLIVPALGSFFYPFWIRFCSSFPIEQNIFKTRLRKVLLFIAPILVLPLAFIFIAKGTKLLFTIGDNSPLTVIIFAITLLLAICTCFISYFIGIWMLIRGYRRMPDTSLRRPMKMIIVGAVAAGLVPFYYIGLSVMLTLGKLETNRLLIIPTLLLLALPVSFGYAIFKHQIMDFRRVVKTTFVYAATMALVAGLYIGIGYALSQAFGAMLSDRVKGTIEVGGFVLLLLLLDPVKRRLQGEIENRFFPQRRDYSMQLAVYSEQISEAVNTEAVARLIADTLRAALDLTNIAIVRWGDGTSQTFSTQTEVSLDDDAMSRLGSLLQDSHSLISLEMSVDPLLSRLRDSFPYVIGLYARGETIGAVLLGTPHGSEAISGRQTPFIGSVVTQGAAAFESVRLLEQELARRQYEEELATARRIQQSLLPSTLPEIPGVSISALSRPAQAVGGDYFNVVQLDDERLMVMVADVSGKGLPASLYMAELHGMVCIASTTCNTAAEILTTINEHLGREMRRGTFVTATVMLLDTARKTVNIARAGHTPTIRLANSTSQTQARMLAPAGMALAMTSNATFASTLEQYTFGYDSGEMFILYSDGVSEAMNDRREEFGDERLLDTVSETSTIKSGDLLDRIFLNVDNFRAGAEQNDDITVVVVRTEKEVEHETAIVLPEETVTV